MSGLKRFRLSATEQVFSEQQEGDLLLPYCMPGAKVLFDEEIAVLVVPTQEGQRVGLPMDLETVADLHSLLGEALRRMQAAQGGRVQ